MTNLLFANSALLLEQAGFHVEFRHDIKSGLERFNEAKQNAKGFDLVLHDLTLPPSFKPEDSLEKIHCYNNVPVIVLTAHSDRSYALKAIAQGAWDFIPKPIDLELLKIIIQRALEKKQLNIRALWCDPS